MVKVIGILTLETVPGLNRHCRNALVAALSRMGLPVLCETEALVTLPLPGSTSTTITPLPTVMCARLVRVRGLWRVQCEGFRSRHRHRAGGLDWRKFLPRSVVAAAVFFLPQTPVECPAEAAALESEYPRAAESPQAGQAPLPRPAAVGAEALQPELRAVGTPRLLSGELLKLRRAPSKNTSAAVADKLAVWAVPAFSLACLPYPNHCGGPGTPLSDSLFISNEIL